MNEGNIFESHEASNEDIMKKLDALQGKVTITDGNMRQGIQQIKENIKNVTRKSKKGLISTGMVTMPNGTVGLVKEYNDQTKSAELFILNVLGPWNVTRVIVKETRQEYFWIWFGESNYFHIIGDCKKLGELYLYRLFVRKGVSFTSSISRKKIGEILYDTFAPLIEKANSNLEISILAGFLDGKYMTKENFMLKYIREFDTVPVMKKSISKNILSEDVVISYANEMQNIKKNNDRLVMGLYPFAGIMASLFEAKGYSLDIVLNAVMLDNHLYDKVCFYLQVLNRNRCTPFAGDVNKKELMEELKNCKDEIMIVDFRSSGGFSRHEKNKIQNNLRELYAIYTRQKVCNENLPPKGLVTISDSIAFETNIFNIFFDSENFVEDEVNERAAQAIEAVFFNFIEFVTENFEYVVNQIGTHTYQKKEAGVSIFTSIYTIVKEFWNKNGYDFHKIMGLDMEIKFEMVFKQGFCDTAELLEIFVYAFRNEVKNCVILSKYDKQRYGEAIRYDESFLWIPSTELKDILKNQGLEEYKYILLLECKKKGILKTDSEGFTRKLQVGGERSEFYQFQRDFFDRPGLVDFTKTGMDRETKISSFY